MRPEPQTKERIRYIAVQYGCFWAVCKEDSAGNLTKVTDSNYTESMAKQLARDLNHEG